MKPFEVEKKRDPSRVDQKVMDIAIASIKQLELG